MLRLGWLGEDGDRGYRGEDKGGAEGCEREGGRRDYSALGE